MAEDGQIPEVVEGFGSGLWMGTGGANIHLPACEGGGLVENAFVARREDHLGLPLVWRISILEAHLPNGTSLYLGFFTDLPDRRGLGGVELAVSGSDRQLITTWTTTTEVASARRVNASSVIWPEPGLGEAATIIGWGLWDAVTDGDLRAFDFTRSDGGKPRTFTFAPGDRPAVGAGEVGLVL
jgi:hypothetical protein